MTLDLVTLVPTGTSPSNSVVTFSSRWQETSNKTLVAGWAGASIRFTFTGTYLSLKFGAQTERKDRWNGGTRMLDVSVYPFNTPRHTLATPLQTQAFDAEPGSDFVVIKDSDSSSGLEKRIVEMTLIDWASVVEVESFVVDANAVIEPLVEAGSDPSPTILVIGDSISCGYALAEDDGGEPFPRGCLDAFPYHAQRISEHDLGCKLDIELVAYPGASLVEPTDEERENGMSFGMANKFHHISPWDSSCQSWEGIRAPVAIVLALGTNDENGDVSFDRFTKATDQFIRKLVEIFPSVREIWIITPFEDFTEAEGSAFRQSLRSGRLTQDIPAGIEVHICDVQEGMTKEMTVDGLHPTLKGQEILGRNFAEFVRVRFESMGLVNKV